MLAQTTSMPLTGDPSDIARRSASAKTGLYFLMAAISSMFFLFLLSYILRSQVSRLYRSHGSRSRGLGSCGLTLRCY